ncbi:MAG TPA: acyl-CoA dehydrogenase family protein, partial [Streptosporangiaceae bacterium]|nr:acyl-CoA dehydrogenase family protein [Streptosporangiaceae bacterium]
MTVGDGSDLTGDQRALRDTLRGVLVTELPTAALRAEVGTDAGYSPQLHTRLTAELGLAGLTIPGEFGGLGLSQAEACVVH